jgi:hypothetical protein
MAFWHEDVPVKPAEEDVRASPTLIAGGHFQTVNCYAECVRLAPFWEAVRDFPSPAGRLRRLVRAPNPPPLAD